MSELSDDEIEEAAREAGISPAELRSALVEQARGVALATMPSGGPLPAPTRGTSVASSESHLPYPPEQAVRSVKRQIERELGSTGHMMGSTAADIYDEPRGVIYRIQATDDGSGGALVRVDVDPTPLRSRRTLTGMGIGATVGLFALAGLIIPGLIGWALIGGAVGLTVLAAGTMSATRRRAIKDARGTTAAALIEAEHQSPIGGAPQLESYDAYDSPKALPPSSDWPGSS